MTPEFKHGRGPEHGPAPDSTQRPLSTLGEQPATMSGEPTEQKPPTQTSDTSRSIALADDPRFVPERDTSANVSGISDERVSNTADEPITPHDGVLSADRTTDRPSPRPKVSVLGDAVQRPDEGKARTLDKVSDDTPAGGIAEQAEKVLANRSETSTPAEHETPQRSERPSWKEKIKRLVAVKKPETPTSDGKAFGETIDNRPEKGRVIDAVEQGETLMLDIFQKPNPDGTEGDVIANISEAFEPNNARTKEAEAGETSNDTMLEGTPDDPIVYVRLHGVRTAKVKEENKTTKGDASDEALDKAPGISIEKIIGSFTGGWHLRYEAKPVPDKQRAKLKTQIDIAKHDANAKQSKIDAGEAGKYDRFQNEVAEADEAIVLRRVVVGAKRSEIDKLVHIMTGSGLPQSEDIRWERQTDANTKAVYHNSIDDALKAPAKIDEYVAASRVAENEVSFIKSPVPGIAVERGYIFATDRNLPPGETIIPFGRIKTNQDKLSKPYPLTVADFGKNFGVFAETGAGKTVAKVQLAAALAVERWNTMKDAIKQGLEKPLKIIHIEAEKGKTAQDMADWMSSQTDLPPEMTEFHEYIIGDPEAEVRLTFNPFSTKDVPSENVAIELGIQTIILASKTENTEEIRMFETYVGGGARRAFSMVKNPTMRFIAKCIREDIENGTYDSEVTGNLSEVSARTLLKVLNGAAGPAFDHGHEISYSELMNDPSGFSVSLEYLDEVGKNLVTADIFTKTRYILKQENGNRNNNSGPRCVWVVDEAYQVFKDTAASEPIAKAPATTRGDRGALIVVTQSPDELAKITRRNLSTTVALAMDPDPVVAEKLGITFDQMRYLKSSEIRPMLVKTSGTDLPIRVEALDPKLAPEGCGSVLPDMTKFMDIGLHEKPQKAITLKQAREFLDGELLGAKLDAWAQLNVIASCDRKALSRGYKAIKGQLKKDLQQMAQGADADTLSAAIAIAVEDACAPRARKVSDDKAREIRDFMLSQIRDKDPMKPTYPDTPLGRLAQAEDKLTTALTPPPLTGPELERYEQAIGITLKGRTAHKQLRIVDDYEKPVLDTVATTVYELGSKPVGDTIELDIEAIEATAKLLGGTSTDDQRELADRVKARLGRAYTKAEMVAFSTLMNEATKLVPKNPEGAHIRTFRAKLHEQIDATIATPTQDLSAIDADLHNKLKHCKTAQEQKKMLKEEQDRIAAELGTDRKNDLADVVYAPSMRREGEAIDDTIDRLRNLAGPQGEVFRRLEQKMGVSDGRLFSVLIRGDGAGKKEWLRTVTNEIMANRADFEMTEAERNALLDAIDEPTVTLIDKAKAAHDIIEASSKTKTSK